MSAIRLRTTRGSWLTPIVALAGCGAAFAGAEALFFAQPFATLAVLLGTPATVVLGAFGLVATGRAKLVVRALALAALVIVIAGIRARWDHTTAGRCSR
jgi:uncharacterized membrane protein YkgB